MEKLFLTADDISKILNFKKNKCYEIVKQLNKMREIEEPNIMTFRGRVEKKYFYKKVGITQQENTINNK